MLKLVTFIKDGREAVGVVSGGLLFPVDEKESGCMLELIENYDRLKPYLQKLPQEGDGIPLANIKLAAPIPRPRHDLICLGMNYLEHAIETARFKGVEFQPPTHAVYFSKRVDRAVATGAPIPSHSRLTRELDYEAELAIVIGKRCTAAAKEKAFEYIFGYTIVNDVSARDLQLIYGGQFYYGKSLDGFTPMGPWIVTADEIADPAHLRISSKVNGELRQASDTGQLIFDIPHIISELSRGVTLEAGDIIITGTPSGVGMGFSPPRYLKSGDIVQCEVEGIGELINPVE